MNGKPVSGDSVINEVIRLPAAGSLVHEFPVAGGTTPLVFTLGRLSTAAACDKLVDCQSSSCASNRLQEHDNWVRNTSDHAQN